MNVDQSIRYSGTYAIEIQRLGPMVGGVRAGKVVARVATCLICHHVIRHHARGNALAAMAMLRGEIQQHVRSRHPEEVAVGKVRA